MYILECVQSILQEVNFRAQLHSGAGVRNHSSRTGISRSLLEFMQLFQSTLFPVAQ